MSSKGIITFFSGTTTKKECRDAKKHKNDKTDYRSLYHEKLKEVLGVKHVYSFSAGRAGLYVILKALGLGEGDEVIVEGYTCVAVSKGVLYTGAMPIYADIDTEDFNVTYESVCERLTDKTKAIVVQHTYGIPCKDIFRIKDFCKEKGIVLIEDCAHVLGQTYEGHMLGTIGDVSFSSTDRTKYISTSIGGFVATNDENIGCRLEEMYKDIPELNGKEINSVVYQLNRTNVLNDRRVYAWIKNRTILGRGIDIYYRLEKRFKKEFYLDDYVNFELPEYTFPAKLPNVMAYVGLSQLSFLEENALHRKKIMDIYKDRLGEKLNVTSHVDAPLRLPLLVEDVDGFIEALSDIVCVDTWFSNTIMCISPKLNRAAYYENGCCPNAEFVTKHVVNLPTHLKVTEEDANRICDRILSVENLHAV